jgi:hypothetical protein
MIILKFKGLITGLMKMVFLLQYLSSTTGNGYVDGTKFEAKNVLLLLVIKPNGT